jgi:hypothetical protein
VSDRTLDLASMTATELDQEFRSHCNMYRNGMIATPTRLYHWVAGAVAAYELALRAGRRLPWNEA